jgi:uncharacterized protein (DUF1697 family)
VLVRLLYASRAAKTVGADDLATILRQSKANNPAQGITGVLALCSTGNVFMQALEGGRAPVNKLYNRIAADPRHADVTVLSYEEIDERMFAGWSMGQVNMSRLNTALVLKYSETAALDPFAVSGRVCLALFNELLATASIVGQS